MNEITLHDISLDKPLEYYLCHQSGAVLHRPGDILSTVHLALLKECAIEKLITVTAAEDPEKIKNTFSTKTVAIDEIPLNEPVPVALSDEKGLSVIKEGALFTADHKQQLYTRGIVSLVYKRDTMELQTFQSDKYCLMLGTDKFECFDALPVAIRENHTPGDTTSPPDNSSISPNAIDAAIPDERFFLHPAKMVTVSSCKEMMMHPLALALPRFEKSPLRQPAKITSGRSRENALDLNKKYSDWVAAIEIPFSNLKSNKETSFDSIDFVGCEIIDLFYRDSFYCCNLLNLRHPPTSDRYLSTHAVNTAILAAGVGVNLGYPLEMLRELTFGALLHDIGHQQTYRPSLSQQDFTSSEQQKYDNHAVVGMAMLKNMTKIPVSAMMIVAQHHEKLDGSGRIFHAVAGRIHELAKIVAAIDAFETRCRFMNLSSALASAITEAQSGKLELRYVKSMVTLLSLFPIGTSVRTKDGLVCKVIGTNEQSFRKPLLRSVYSMQGEHLFPIDKKELIDMNKRNIAIVEEVRHSALKSDITAGFFDE